MKKLLFFLSTLLISISLVNANTYHQKTGITIMDKKTDQTAYSNEYQGDLEGPDYFTSGSKKY